MHQTLSANHSGACSMCVNDSFRSRVNAVILSQIAFRVGPKSYSVLCEHSLNESHISNDWQKTNPIFFYLFQGSRGNIGAPGGRGVSGRRVYYCLSCVLKYCSIVFPFSNNKFAIIWYMVAFCDSFFRLDRVWTPFNRSHHFGVIPDQHHSDWFV